MADHRYSAEDEERMVDAIAAAFVHGLGASSARVPDLLTGFLAGRYHVLFQHDANGPALTVLEVAEEDGGGHLADVVPFEAPTVRPVDSVCEENPEDGGP